MKDGFSSAALEKRRRPKKRSSLRWVSGPGCGLAYSTNGETDLCLDCEKKRVEAS